MNGYKKRMFQTNEKNYSHKFFVNKNICDDKVQNREKTCFKTSGANGVLDILLWVSHKVVTSSNLNTPHYPPIPYIKLYLSIRVRFYCKFRIQSRLIFTYSIRIESIRIDSICVFSNQILYRYTYILYPISYILYPINVSHAHRSHPRNI